MEKLRGNILLDPDKPVVTVAQKKSIQSFHSLKKDLLTTSISNSATGKSITSEVPYTPSPAIAEAVQWVLAKNGGYGNDTDGNKVALDVLGDQTRPIQRGSCYDFDGTDDYVNTGQTFQSTFQSSFSISLWVKPDDGQPAAIGDILGWLSSGYTHRIHLEQRTNRYLRFSYGADGNTCDTYSDGEVWADGSVEWTHVVWTVTPIASTLYINGVENNSGDMSSVTMGDFAGRSLFLGCAHVNTSAMWFFDGKLRDVRIYSTALTPTQIASVYANEIITDNLVAMYKCDEQAGSTAYDSSGNGYHGTINNATLSTFHATQNEYSFQNEVGYSRLGTVMVPRDESDPTKDVLGNALDYTGRVKYNANLVGSNCATFDGADDYIDCGDDDIFTFGDGSSDEPFSISFWMKTHHTNEGYDSTAGIVTKFSVDSGLGEWVVLRSGNNLYFRVCDGTYTDWIGRVAMTSIYTDQLYHIVCTYDGSGTHGGLKIYIDTVQADDTDQSSGSYTAMQNTGQPVELGRYEYAGGTREFDGQIFDVRIFDSELSADEVEDVYKDTSTLSSIAHYPLAEGGGATAYDVSGNENHGTVTNATLSTFWGTTQDKYHHNLLEGFSGALYFDGSDDYVDTGVTFQSTFRDSFSVSCWIKPVDGQPTSNEYFLGGKDGDNRVYAYIDTSGKINFGIKDGTINGLAQTSSAVFSNGVQEWTHITLVAVADTQLYIYVNGAVQTLDGTNDGDVSGLTFANITTSQAFYLGAYNNWGSDSNHFAGQMKDIRIFSAALSASQVSQVYAGMRLTDNLVSRWDFTDLTGSTLSDAQGSNDGTISGAAWLRIPKDQTAPAKDISGAPLLFSGGHWHNKSETELQQEQAPALIQADIESGNDFWFDSTSSYAAQEVSYADIDDNDNDADVIFADTTLIRRKKNLLTYEDAQTGTALTRTQKFVNIS